MDAEEQRRIRESEQQVKPDQSLRETWTVEYTRMRYDSPVVARLVDWPWSTKYVSRGEGESVDRARLEMVKMLARGIWEDPNLFGDLGNVAHVAQVFKFLNALIDAGNEGLGDDYRPQSEWYLPENLMEDEQLPEGWEDVVRAVITAFQQWADYFPEEGTLEEKGLKTIGMDEVRHIAERGRFKAPDDVEDRDATQE